MDLLYPIIFEIVNIMPSNERGSAIIILVAILLVTIIGLSFIFGQKIFQSNKQADQVSSSLQKTTSQSLNPNTGDLYQDIKVRMKEVLK